MAISGVGITFSKWNTSSSEWELLSGVLRIDLLDAKKEVIPVVKLDTTNGVKSFIQGEIDYGTIMLSINYTMDILFNLITDFQNTSENQNYLIILPDGAFIEFEGFISSMPFKAELESQLIIEVSIKITDEPIFDIEIDSEDPEAPEAPASELPIVETLVIANSEYGNPNCSVDFRVNLTDLGTATPFSYVGIWWGPSSNAGDYSIGSGLGTLGIRTFSVNNNLPPGTLIYYKAYATNAAGTVYGDILSYMTPSS